MSVDQTIEQKDLTESEGRLLNFLVPVIMHSFWVIPSLYLMFLMPYLRDTGYSIPVNEKLSLVLTERFHSSLSDRGIGYLKSGSGSMIHGGSVSIYPSYEGLAPQAPMASWDYSAPAYTPHMHAIVQKDGIEIRYKADTSNPFEEELKKLERIIQYAIDQQDKSLDISNSWNQKKANISDKTIILP